ncbi:hypothetical protein G7046_g1230 [Stylonectria norvegica]|nr:hypothetical protein G7046_g1230 [Stylonectria norvegica]
MDQDTAFSWESSFPLTQQYESLYRPDGSRKASVTQLVEGPNKPRQSRKESSRQLACTSCRRKKVKCHPSTDGRSPCTLCAKVGTECVVPIVDERKLSNSRRLITQLYGRIAALESELEEHRNICATSDEKTWPPQLDVPDLGASPESSSAASEASSNPDNMIVRLCGGQRQLNSDRAGRLRFFGPTSSLHLSESVTSSVLIREPNSSRGRYQWQDTISADLQNHLFELYWKYQHQVLPIIHKEAFLNDLENGQTKYCSKLLVYCILTRAASISEDPEIRALALAEDDTNEDPPFLVNRCATLLDAELNNPGITTLQSLQLLSDIYCVICNDTKGWLDAGGACRLAFELGLHSDSKGLGSTALSQVDLEIRHIAFWSCFSLDRQWALYLGRPQMIKTDDVTAKKPEHTSSTSEELEISIVWANLLEIVGVICDALNGVQTTKHRVASLDQKLRDWNSSLDTPFHYHRRQTPSISLLHMQYSAAAILLHRPLATFGSSPPNPSPSSKVSKDICVHHACLIAQYLQHYQEHHGSVLTMSWIVLHMIATASTTLIANLSENGAGSGVARQLSCLQTCIRALTELEKSHIPTRRVRKVIQQAMRILCLDTKVNNAAPLDCGSQSLTEEADFANSHLATIPADGTGNGAMLMADFAIDWSEAFLSIDEFLPPGSQIDMLQSFESFLA